MKTITTLQPTEMSKVDSEAFRLTPTISIVAGEEHEGPLKAGDLTMQFGEPVIANGTNYSELATLYLQALGLAPSNQSFLEWNARPLGNFAQRAASSEMSYSHRLLVLYDILRREGFCGKRLHEALVGNCGYGSTERTLRRQVAHARLALILAAAGKIDLLPSQNVSGTISSRLPRPFWRAFLSKHQIKEAEAATVKKAIDDFGANHGIPLKGQQSGPLKPLPLHRIPELIPINAPSASNEKLEEAEIERSAHSKSGNLPKKAIAKVLAAELKGRVPAYHLKNPEDFALAFLMAIDKSISSVPCPGRHQDLDELASVLGRLDEKRIKRATQAAMRLVIGKALDDASSQAGARPRKKVTPDTPCPESHNIPTEPLKPTEEPFL